MILRDIKTDINNIYHIYQMIWIEEIVIQIEKFTFS